MYWDTQKYRKHRNVKVSIIDISIYLSFLGKILVIIDKIINDYVIVEIHKSKYYVNKYHNKSIH